MQKCWPGIKIAFLAFRASCSKLAIWRAIRTVHSRALHICHASASLPLGGARYWARLGLSEALAGMQGRSLPAEQVLPLLRKQEGELCCQYLEFLVVGRGSQVPEHHTELALSLATAALQLMPHVDDRCECSGLSSL